MGSPSPPNNFLTAWNCIYPSCSDEWVFMFMNNASTVNFILGLRRDVSFEFIAVVNLAPCGSKPMEDEFLSPVSRMYVSIAGLIFKRGQSGWWIVHFSGSFWTYSNALHQQQQTKPASIAQNQRTRDLQDGCRCAIKQQVLFFSGRWSSSEFFRTLNNLITSGGLDRSR